MLNLDLGKMKLFWSVGSNISNISLLHNVKYFSRLQNLTPVPIGSNQWALSDWISENDEDSVLAAVLQQSAQEFFKKDS